MLKNCLNNLIQLDDLKKEVASYGDTLWSTQDILNMINDIPVAEVIEKHKGEANE